MAIEDWLPFDSYDGDEDSELKVCNRCGADGLLWEEARGERNQKCWVLVTLSGAVHECFPAAEVIAMFDNV